MIDPLAFVGALVMLLGLPGPTNTLFAASGATGGIRAGARLIVPVLLGYLVATLAVRLALGPLMAMYPLLGIGLKLALALLLLVMAIQLMRNATDRGGRSVTGRAMFFATLLNPKAPVVALVILPQGVPHEWLYWMAFLALVPGLGLGWVLLGRALGQVAGASHALVSRVSGLVLAVFASVIAFSALN
jgi:threonine/homoserine/homoserine lactone efflux protein